MLAAGQRRSVDHRDRLDSCCVVQAQDHKVNLCHQRAFGDRILAQVLVNPYQLHLRHGLKALADLQAGGAGFTVDEYFGHGAGFLVVKRTRPCKLCVGLTQCSMIHLRAVVPQPTVVNRIRQFVGPFPISRETP